MTGTSSSPSNYPVPCIAISSPAPKCLDGTPARPGDPTKLIALMLARFISTDRGRLVRAPRKADDRLILRSVIPWFGVRCDEKIGDALSRASVGSIPLSGSFHCGPCGHEPQARTFAGDPGRREARSLL